jgi:O-antigen ligase/tetratricopeptide (TPR) repeat protein
MSPRPAEIRRADLSVWLDGLARSSLLTATALLPWAFGGVDAFSQYLMFLPLVLATGACLIRSLLVGSTPSGLPAMALPAGLLILLGGIQTLDVGETAVQRWSPRAAELRADLRPESPVTDVPRPSTLSLYVPATRKEVALLVAGLAVLLIARQVFTTPTDVLWLSGVLATNGALLAYFGIVQKLSWNGQLYWSISPGGSTPFGPFVNRNGAGGYFVLCLAAAVPLLTMLWGRWRSGSPASVNRRVVWPQRRPWYVPPAEAIWLGVAALLVLLLSGLLVSMSRGAWLGAVLAALAALGLVGRSWFRPAGLLGLLLGLLVAGGLLAWLNLDSEVGERVATLSDEASALRGRWELWQDVLRMAPDFWQTGTGLGTFGLIQPLYQTSPMRVWYDQAENLFLQALAEAGVPGGLLLLSLPLVALWSIRSLWRGSPDRLTAAVAGMAVAAIVGQTVCASFDFSLRYPANQWGLAMVVGAALGFAGRLAAGASPPSRPRWRAALVPGVLLLGLGAAWWEIAWAGGVDLALVRGQSRIDEQTLSAEELDDTLLGLQTLLLQRTDDAEAHLRIAGLHIVRYRQQAWAELQDELGDDATREELWELTSPLVLHQRAAEFVLTDDATSLEELRAEPVIREHLRPAVESALRARELGPLLSGSHQILADLAFLRGDPLDNVEDIRRAVLLMPENPERRYWAGRLHLDAGRLDAAVAEWRECLRLLGDQDEEILAIMQQLLPVDRLVADLLPPSPRALIRLANRETVRTAEADFRTQFGLRMLALLEEPATDALSPDERAIALGLALHLTGDFARAVPELRRATALAPQHVEWRMLLAQVLGESGDLPQAVREAATCVQLVPHNRRARQLHDRLLQEALNHRERSAAPAP